jgi:hypothetical protein
MKVLETKEPNPEYQRGFRARHFERMHYRFKKNHKTGLNILPEYYEILWELSRGELGEYLSYLYYKYHKQIFALKVSPNKKTATAEYQPKTKRYVQICLYKIYPYIWEKYWDLRRLTGYSISFIIRIFLEWELEEQSRNNEIENGIPLVRKLDGIEIHNVVYPIGNIQNSYEEYKSGSNLRNDIFIYYKDIFE